MFQNRTVFIYYNINIWENADGCAKQYLCATELYLLSILEHAYNIIIYRGVGAPVNGREFFGGLNATGKRLLLMLMTTVKLPVA